MEQWLHILIGQINTLITSDDYNMKREPEWFQFFSQKIVVKSGDIYKTIQVADIHFLQAHSNYTIIVTQHEKLLSCKTLKYWQEKITPYNFVRLHNSYLVNKIFIRAIDPTKNLVMMQNGAKIRVSRTLKNLTELLELKTA